MTIADVRLGLVAYLYADRGISLLVDGHVARSLGGKRIFPMKLQQGIAKPSIVYQRISGQGDHHMQGPSGLNRIRMQIDCWASSADIANDLANRVKSRIDGFRGSMTWGDASPEDAIVVQGIFFDSERDLYDDAVKLYAVSRDYLIWYEEA